MNEDPDRKTPDLDRLWCNKRDNTEKFREEWQDVWFMADTLFFSAKDLIGSFVGGCQSTGASHRVMMWQTAIEYLMQSFFLNIDRQLDEAMALLRMVAELSRDLARISDDENHLELWLTRKSNKSDSRRSRGVFKFDDNDSAERQLHKLYDLASIFGIHGHTLKSMSSSPVDLSESAEIVVLAVKDKAVHEQLVMWFMAFSSVQFVCIKAFHGEKSLQASEAVQRFLKIQDGLADFLKNYQIAVAEMRDTH